jgi:3',5'-cyclic-AMP phosphodiesterase
MSPPAGSCSIASTRALEHPPIWSTAPMSELVALREPQGLADVIRGSDVRLILSGHTHRVSAGTLAGVPVWIGPSTGSHADVLARNGFRGHTGGGFTRVDIRDDGEIVATRASHRRAAVDDERPYEASERAG